MIYIPLLGWALWTGTLFSCLVEAFGRVVPGRLRPVVTIVVVAVELLPILVDDRLPEGYGVAYPHGLWRSDL